MLAMFPLPVWAEVCDKERPNWDGVPATAFDEAISLFSTAPSLALLLATALVIRFRSQWGALAVFVLWTVLISIIAFADPTSIRIAAIDEGCIGPNTLFITAVVAICIGMILYTVPRPGRSD
jgi:hypothetical protein